MDLVLFELRMSAAPDKSQDVASEEHLNDANSFLKSLFVRGQLSYVV